jgi:magnesium-protoporphyrin O-methyltransferase
MPCSCCSFGDAAEQQFTSKKVAKELRGYRRNGAGPTTRLLRDGLARAGLATGALLDVGGGLGVLTLDLLDLGMSRAVVVEASSAYLAAASEEAARRGRSTSIQFVHGDFLAVTNQLPRSTVVTLDRVVCCYPFFESLLGQALGHAERGFAFSYPRDRWYVRVAVWLENAMRKLRANPFRTFVHPVAQNGAARCAGWLRTREPSQHRRVVCRRLREAFVTSSGGATQRLWCSGST